MNHEIDPEKLIAIIFIAMAGFFIFRNLFMNEYFSKKVTLIIMAGFVLIGLFRFMYNYRNKKLGKEKKNKFNLKDFLKGFWEIIVLIAYVKFYVLCVVTYCVVLILAIYILSENGADIQAIAKAGQISIWFAYAGVTVIIIDKFSKFRKQ